MVEETEKLGADEHYCSSCGSVIKKAAELCPKCGVRAKSQVKTKSKVTAGLLALFLGGIGAHKFYLGYTGIGLLYLFLFWTFIPAILAFIEAIIYLTKSDEDFHKTYVENKKSFF